MAWCYLALPVVPISGPTKARLGSASAARCLDRPVVIALAVQSSTADPWERHVCVGNHRGRAGAL